MSNLSASRTVGEIAAEFPATVRVFQKHEIDFCCGGRLPLEQACAAKGLAADAVLAELDQATATRTAGQADWQTAPLSDLVDHILSRHHDYLKSELPRLSAMMAKVIAAHGEKHGEVVKPLGQTLEMLKGELEAHLWKEEMVLFPLIRNLEEAAQEGHMPASAHCGSVNNPIRVMLMEHDDAGAALERMRQITGNYAIPEGVCNTYRALYELLKELEADLHQHIHLENNILFPRAAALEAE